MKLNDFTQRIRQSFTINTRRRNLKATPSAAIESFEPRVLLTTAVIDFDGEEITGEEMFQGAYPVGPKSADSFESLFSGQYPHLDMNGNETVDEDDAALAQERIMEKVRMDYMPYKLTIIEGDQDDYQYLMTPELPNDPSDDDGDVIVIVSGNTHSEMGFASPSLGIAPSVDVTNKNDTIVFVFGKGIAETTDTADQFINLMAIATSHEMAHSFGLDHVTTPAEGYDAEVLSHEIMSAPYVDLNNPNVDHDDQVIETRDFDHNSVFQDITYVNESGFEQNSHQHLTNVLGESGWAWMAVLKPGELTLQGATHDWTIANDLSVTQVDGNTWQAQVVYQRRWPEGWFRTISHTAFVDTSNPDINSLNPFAQELTSITIQGSDYHDIIDVDEAITVPAEINGMGGDDDISGGGGNDTIMGGDGLDKIMGNGGADWLDGGNDRFEDILDGGNDRYRDTFVTYYTETFNSRLGKMEKTTLDTVYNLDRLERDELYAYATTLANPEKDSDDPEKDGIDLGKEEPLRK